MAGSKTRTKSTVTSKTLNHAAGRKALFTRFLCSKIVYIYKENHHKLLDYHPKVKHFIYLRYLSGPLTESEICGSSEDRRKFYLCKNRNLCLRIPSIVDLFRSYREHTVTKPSNTLKQRSETAETNELSSCFPHTSGNSPTKISLGPAANTESIVSRLQQFASKYQSTQRTTYDQSYIPSAGHRGEEEMLSNVLEICCRFCNTVNPPARQVPFYCPFQVYIPIYF